MISVIVPVYNAEDYIEDCINHIQKQTIIEWELILVDDGSIDNSPAICDWFGATDERLRVIHQKNAGVSNARNLGIEKAAGDFLLFCDADDWLEENALEILSNAQSTKDADIVFADIYTVHGSSRTYTKVFGNEFDLPAMEIAGKIQRACIGYSYNPFPTEKPVISGLGSVGNKLIRTDLVRSQSIRFDSYTYGIYEDNLFTIACLDHANQIAYVSKPVYNYRQVSTSSIHRFRPESLEITKRVFERVEDIILKKDDKKSFEKALHVLIIRRLSEELRVYYFNPDNPKSAREARKELHMMIHSKPYVDAVKNVKIEGLMPAHKLTCLTAKTGSATIMWLAYVCRAAIKKAIS